MFGNLWLGFLKVGHLVGVKRTKLGVLGVLSEAGGEGSKVWNLARRKMNKILRFDAYRAGAGWSRLFAISGTVT